VWATVGLGALAMLWSSRLAYGGFVPLHEYDVIHAHLMAAGEGLFLGYYTLVGAWAALGLALAAWYGTRFSLVDLSRRLTSGRTLWCTLACLAGVAALAAWAVGDLLLDGAFLTDDEMAMLFQARLLTEGCWWADSPPFGDVFEYAMMVESPRWYGIYPAGHPLVMAASLLLTGDERLLLVLGAALWVLLTYRLARQLFDSPTALLACALLVVSPFFLFSSGTRASELTSGLFVLVAANLVVTFDGPRPLARAVGLGLALAGAYVARPYTTLAVALPWIPFVAWLWWRRSVPWWSPLMVVLAALPGLVLYLWVNSQLTGSPWLTPYEVNFPGRFRLGFGQDAFGIIHSPEMAWAIVGLTLFELNAWLLGWPLSLVPVGLALLLDRPPRRAWLVLATPLCVILAFLPVPMAGVHDTGPLYYLEVLPALVIAAARGLVVGWRRLALATTPRTAELVPWFAVASALVGVVFFGAHQVAVLGELADFNNSPYRVAHESIDGPAVVFVENIQTTPPSSWVLGLRPPRPGLSDRLLFVNVANLARAAEVMRWARPRRAYYLSRDQMTGAVSLLPLPAFPGG
jgi:hypothetical protein